MQEKRRFTRYQVPLHFRYENGSPTDYEGYASDVSMSGAKIMVDKARDLYPELPIALYFNLPGKQLRIEAKVAWVVDHMDSKEVGIYFVKCPDAFKEDLYNHISTYYRDELTKRWW